MDQNIERRAAALELRTNGRRLFGVAAPFLQWTNIGEFRERIEPGAFTDSIHNTTATRDIVALVDHDRTRLLGRTRNGTLRLAEDDVGLRFEVDLPLTQLGQDTLALVERGDVGGMSIGFRVKRDYWENQGRDRTLRKVTLIDVSVVSSFPAYPQTSVSARSAGGNRKLSLMLAEWLVKGFGS